MLLNSLMFDKMLGIFCLKRLCGLECRREEDNTPSVSTLLLTLSSKYQPKDPTTIANLFYYLDMHTALVVATLNNHV